MVNFGGSGFLIVAIQLDQMVKTAFGMLAFIG